MAIRGVKANQRPLASGAATFQLLHITGVLISQFATANTASFHEFPFTNTSRCSLQSSRTSRSSLIYLIDRGWDQRVKERKPMGPTIWCLLSLCTWADLGISLHTLREQLVYRELTITSRVFTKALSDGTKFEWGLTEVHVAIWGKSTLT